VFSWLGGKKISFRSGLKIGASFFNGNGYSSLINMMGIENLTSIGGDLCILDNAS
jgi:hypothetical protein